MLVGDFQTTTGEIDNSSMRGAADRSPGNMPRLASACVLAMAWLAVPCRADPPAQPAIDFEASIAPILIRNCVSCHGASERKGGLALDTAEHLRAGGLGGPAIKPGDPAGSFLISRLKSGEMPPEGGGEPLTAETIQVISDWIAAGADWPPGRTLSALELTTERRAGYDWWSLRPIQQVPVPSVARSDWVRTPIDAFLLAKMEQASVQPSSEVDRGTFLRRVKFDLLGLPPTLAEIAEFQGDDSANAHERLVDRLLASPHYGERWGRHWLDVVHYADTHGFERDQKRPNAWHYRDYVIEAFNQDLPYDQFLREQIAGDVLLPQEPRGVVATGFLVAGPWDYVGIVETLSEMQRRKARADDLDDIVSSTLSATLGLTVNCARCHDHKFDPISQADYYRLTAVFAGVRRDDRALGVWTDEARDARVAELNQQLGEIRSQIARLEGRDLDLADLVGAGDGHGSGQRGTGLDPRNGRPTKGQTQALADVVVNAFVKSDVPGIDGLFIPDGDVGAGPTAVLIDSSGEHAFAGFGDTSGNSWDYVQNGAFSTQASGTLDGTDFLGAGHAQLGLHANKGITFDLDAIRRAHPDRIIERFRGTLGQVNEHGSADFWLLVDGVVQVEQRGLGGAVQGIPLDVELDPQAKFLTLVATDGGNGINCDQVIVGDPRLVCSPAPALDAEGRTRLAALAMEQQARQRELEQLPPVVKAYAAVSSDPGEVRILRRGDTESPQKVVQPGALACLSLPGTEFGDAALTEGERRLALARWITDARNPLARRVIVNRLWHYHFGKGLVATPSDFGFNGGKPSHPELLDWLADELLRRGWSLKALQRLIVLSSVYRQQSTSDDRSAIDADNRLLWRMNPRRLEAEVVRDAILATSQRLNPALAGPAFEPFTYTEKYAPVYDYLTQDRPEWWRRSVYAFTVRSVPDRLLEVLDLPNPCNCTPVRSTTTTALQALALLNHPFVIQQAGFFAQRLEREAESEAERIERGFQLALGRSPTEAELALGVQFVSQQGLKQFCRMLFNANEFLYVD